MVLPADICTTDNTDPEPDDLWEYQNPKVLTVSAISSTKDPSRRANAGTRFLFQGQIQGIQFSLGDLKI